MKKLLFLSATALVIWACGNSSGKTADAAAGEAQASVDGEAVYKTYCVNCHGLKGDMGGAGAFNLQVSELSLEERMQVIKNGRGLMAGLGSLMSPEEIEAVAQYTFTLKEQ